MPKSQIILSKYSPLMAVDCRMISKSGKPEKMDRVTSLCRCGESKYKPFCDGTHATINFDGSREDSDKKELEYYRGAKITIVFDRYLCMGAGYCGELEPVFGTHDAPKYEPDAAPVEELIETIRKCPSGALSYIIDGVHHRNYFEGLEQIVVEEDGPLNIQGTVTLIDDQDSDKLLPMADHYVLCRCGGSKKKPICDGSHLDNGFKG